MPDHPSPPSIGNAAWLRAPATQRLFAALSVKNHTARAVGGCVRNTLLAALDGSSSPVTDIDIATTATPEEVIALVEADGLKSVPTGLQHGTITVVADEDVFEVTTLRRDLTTDGRHAEVAFTDDWCLDAARRDLTINAIYANADGTIFDPLGSYADLRAKKVRFVGDPVQRIREDYLRILRFFRFYAQYGEGTPDIAGLEACVCERQGLALLSKERIHQELVKLLVAPAATSTLGLMASHGILTEILPVAPNIPRLERLMALENQSPDTALRIAALAIHTANDVNRLSNTLKLSRTESKTLKIAADVLDRGSTSLPGPKQARQLLYQLGTEDYLRHVNILFASNPISETSVDATELQELPNTWQPPTFPIGGSDLLNLGVVEGPEVGRIIKRTQNYWLENDFKPDRSNLLRYAEQLINK